ncbi:MAG TPA: hypothetical protein VF604_04035 [Pyrinomonadaceae bacterium]|jgi:hypothetical protein
MSRKIQVHSIEALQHLERILGMFAGKISETLDLAESNMQRKLDWLENCCRDLNDEAISCEEAYDSADEDDDIGYLAYKRDQANAEAQQARRNLTRVEASYAEYKRAARRADYLSSERILAAQAFLRQKVTELQNYAALQLDIGAVTSSGDGLINSIIDATSDLMSNTLQNVENVVDELVQIALPKGFEWVRLEEISPDEIANLPEQSEYKKVSYEKMKDGFKILQDDVLPALKSTGTIADEDYFYNFDRENNRALANSTEEIFKVFFGSSEPICLDRDHHTHTFKITSGRHRIKVARDLGWSAVPAKII